MKRLFIIIFLVIVEIASMKTTIFASNFEVTSVERDLYEIQNNSASFVGAKVFMGILITLIISTIAVGAYRIVIALAKVTFKFGNWTVFLFQWLILFLVWLTCLAININYLLKS